MAIVNRIFTVLGKPADEKDIQVRYKVNTAKSKVQLESMTTHGSFLQWFSGANPANVHKWTNNEKNISLPSSVLLKTRLSYALAVCFLSITDSLGEIGSHHHHHHCALNTENRVVMNSFWCALFFEHRLGIGNSLSELL